MVRYGFTWHLQTLSGGGVDANNDPIPQTQDWTPFTCDAQGQTGRFTLSGTGDQISISYIVYYALGQGLTFEKGANVRDHKGVERVILESEYNYFTV